MGDESQAVSQAANIVPARIGYAIAVAVDSTSRGYDLTKLQSWQLHPGQENQMYWSLQNDGSSDIYYAFDQQAVGVNKINDATILSAGSALAFDAQSVVANASQGSANCMCTKIPAGVWKDERVDRVVDATLILKCAANTTSTLRIWISSQPMNGAA